MSTGLLSSLLNTQSQTPTPAGQKMQVVMVPRELIMANPDNKKIYIVGDVSGLKDDIRENGVRQPLEVIRWANGYKLIGGERRLTACKQLADEGDKRFESLPCLILDSRGELDDKIALITANATARDLTDGERVAQYEALKDVLTRKKKAGQLEGKVRDECCRILGLSAGAAARLNVIATCENETIKQRLMAGEIGLMEAYRYAQDYAQYTKQKETPEEPEETPKTASVETLPKTAPSELDILEKDLEILKHAAKSVAKPVEPEKPAADLAAPKEKAPNPAGLSERGRATLLALAEKTLKENAGWIFDRDMWQFKLTFRYKELPGKAKLWRLDDNQRDAFGLAPGEHVRYAIILNDGNFATIGWEGYNDAVESLVKYFDLK